MFQLLLVLRISKSRGPAPLFGGDAKTTYVSCYSNSHVSCFLPSSLPLTIFKVRKGRSPKATSSRSWEYPSHIASQRCRRDNPSRHQASPSDSKTSRRVDGVLPIWAHLIINLSWMLGIGPFTTQVSCSRSHNLEPPRPGLA